ncbi:MAG: aryl-sulfate sulfotransferase [Thermoplasmatota archaeon]
MKTTYYNDIFSGQILFAPMYSGTTYLIDNNGVVNRTWSSNYWPYWSVYLLNDGSLLRSIQTSKEEATHGGIEKYSSDGTIIWHYEYFSPNQYWTHHDFKPLPNGHVLMIASEIKTRAEALAMGRNPMYIQGDKMISDFLVEIEPNGPNSGNIIWQWHVWDHLIQDYDPSKANYGVVKDHPELLDINFGPSSEDWLHCNSVDYNPQFDQILISFRNLNEIWIIDHSTTTNQASNHSGGKYGHGGDILYRWGNPQTYRAGNANDQKLFGQHDATWTKPSYPGEGDILIFNNGLGRGYSSVDEITPPVDKNGEYYLEPGFAYGPENLTWSYTATPPNSFYADYISGAQRLPDGNTLICDGPSGRFFEVTTDKTIIWQYINPYPNPMMNRVFKIEYISPSEPVPPVPDLDCTGSLTWNNVRPGETRNGSFQLQNIGDPGSLLNWKINSSSLNWGIWTITPDCGENLTPEDGQVTIHVSVVAPNQKNTQFNGYIRVENLDDSTDYDLIPVYLKTQKNIPLFLFLKNHFRFLHLFYKL